VQVSTDGGQTWNSLANVHTTDVHDPSAHPKVVENLPGLTGSSGDWVTMSFDLSAYAGQDILIAFRYVTDWANVHDGWYIDNVYVDDTLISDGSSTEPFMDITEVAPIENDFTVQLIGAIEKRNRTSYRVVPLPLDNTSEEGGRENVRRIFQDSDYVVMVVTFDAPVGFTGYANYTYEVIYNGSGPK
jgi:bacillopeptidase F (M6 metalloprotease family)